MLIDALGLISTVQLLLLDPGGSPTRVVSVHLSWRLVRALSLLQEAAGNI